MAEQLMLDGHILTSFVSIEFDGNSAFSESRGNQRLTIAQRSYCDHVGRHSLPDQGGLYRFRPAKRQCQIMGFGARGICMAADRQMSGTADSRGGDGWSDLNRCTSW